ncbi:MAG: hypothetical protein GW823_05210 [Bacteroidetes bacterium]|nr:hypothetical protein [Bacteroidota bacterium]
MKKSTLICLLFFSLSTHLVYSQISSEPRIYNYSSALHSLIFDETTKSVWFIDADNNVSTINLIDSKQDIFKWIHPSSLNLFFDSLVVFSKKQNTVSLMNKQTGFFRSVELPKVQFTISGVLLIDKRFCIIYGSDRMFDLKTVLFDMRKKTFKPIELDSGVYGLRSIHLEKTGTVWLFTEDALFRSKNLKSWEKVIDKSRFKGFFSDFEILGDYLFLTHIRGEIYRFNIDNLDAEPKIVNQTPYSTFHSCVLNKNQLLIASLCEVHYIKEGKWEPIPNFSPHIETTLIKNLIRFSENQVLVVTNLGFHLISLN